MTGAQYDDYHTRATHVSGCKEDSWAQDESRP